MSLSVQRVTNLSSQATVINVNFVNLITPYLLIQLMNLILKQNQQTFHMYMHVVYVMSGIQFFFIPFIVAQYTHF